jgi:uncharacterized protein GlcG (DUF336 family)
MLGAGAALALSLALPASAQLIARRDLSYSMALAMATGALDACKARGYPVSVVVVDRGGDVIGGIGLSGSPGVDEECVNAGIDKVKQFLQ